MSWQPSAYLPSRSIRAFRLKQLVNSQTNDRCSFADNHEFESFWPFLGPKSPFCLEPSSAGSKFQCNEIQRRYSLSTEDRRSFTKLRFQALPTVRLVPHTDHAFPRESEDDRAAPHA